VSVGHEGYSAECWHSQQGDFDARYPFLLTQSILYAGDASSASHACKWCERAAEVSERGSSPESLLFLEGGFGAPWTLNVDVASMLEAAVSACLDGLAAYARTSRSSSGLSGSSSRGADNGALEPGIAASQQHVACSSELDPSAVQPTSAARVQSRERAEPRSAFGESTRV
jgi:hypothetical protein